MIQYISKPFKWFFKLEAASGLVLLFAAAIALIISNSDLSTYYKDILNTYSIISCISFIKFEYKIFLVKVLKLV